MKIGYYFLVLIFLSAILFSCGDELDLSQFPITNTGVITISDTTYVLQNPVWTGFNQPEDIHIGFEPLVYVADTKNNRVVQMDISGVIIGTLDVFRPRKITQDYNLDLLIIADTVLSTSDTISVVYRVKTAEIGGVITNATKISLLNSLYQTPNSSPLRKFTGISVFPDNSFIISRIGPEDPFGIDPGNALLKGKGRNQLSSLVVLSGFQSSGSSFYSIEKLSSVLTVRNSPTDFIVSRSTQDTITLNKVLWFTYDQVNGTYDPKFTSSGDDIVNIKFGKPDDLAQDNNLALYVIDSYRNFLFKFSAGGVYQNVSFGGYGNGDKTFNNPKGISFYNKVIYIADTGNNRILRYKLSTDLN